MKVYRILAIVAILSAFGCTSEEAPVQPEPQEKEETEQKDTPEPEPEPDPESKADFKSVATFIDDTAVALLRKAYVERVKWIDRNIQAL